MPSYFIPFPVFHISCVFHVLDLTRKDQLGARDDACFCMEADHVYIIIQFNGPHAASPACVYMVHQRNTWTVLFFINLEFSMAWYVSCHTSTFKTFISSFVIAN